MNLFLSLGHGFKALKAQLRCSWTSAGRWGRRAWPRSSRAPPKRSWAPASRWAARWMARSPAPCNRPSMKTSGSCPLSEPNLDKFKSRRFAEKNAESVLGEGYKVEGLGRSWGVWTVHCDREWNLCNRNFCCLGPLGVSRGTSLLSTIYDD